MQAMVSPADAIAGEVFGTQPSISVFDSKGILAVELSGYVYAEMGVSPVEYEPLWLGECNVSSCGTQVEYDMARVTLNNGIADFKDMNLQIRRAGSGYTLRFITVNAFGSPIAFTFSDEFDVALGDPYTLALDPSMGHVQGGLPFDIQPSVVITDRGGNIVTSVDEGNAYVDLYRSPFPDEVLHTTETRMATFNGGTAQFEGLYLNKVGGPYELIFNTSLVSFFHPYLFCVK
jgi:hypothetical protein